MLKKFAGRRVSGQNLLRMVAILLPVITAGLIAIFYGMTKGVAPLPMPQWNDEAAYYEQVKLWLTTGPSRGYWGFNGGHALLGTGGAWSPAILFPYCAFGLLFGWHTWSTALANVLFLCLANAAFLVLVKVQKQQTVFLLVLEAVSTHLLLYSNTIMSEVLRYALALVLAGLLYRLLFAQTLPTLRYRILTGLYLLVLAQIYIFFVFAVPIYICGLLRRRSRMRKILFSFAGLLLVSGASYGLLHLISSNYNIFKTEKLFTALTRHDFGGAVYSFLWMAWAGLHDLWQCMRSATGHGMFHWFVPFLAVMALLPLAVLLRDHIRSRAGQAKALQEDGTAQRNGTALPRCLDHHDRKILAIVAYSILLYTGAYITVYSLEAFTFFRGMGIVVLFSLALLLMLHEKRPVILLLLCYAVGLIFVPANLHDFNTERYQSAQVRESWTQLADQLEEALPLTDAAGTQTDPTAVRWSNTAVLYTMEPKLICAMPAGLGVNFMMYSDQIIDNAGYLVFSLQDEAALRSDWLEQSYAKIYAAHGTEIEENFFIQYQSADYIIYKHRSPGSAVWKLGDGSEDD